MHDELRSNSRSDPIDVNPKKSPKRLNMHFIIVLA